MTFGVRRKRPGPLGHVQLKCCLDEGLDVKPREDDLCRAFAEALKEQPEFASWVLARTKFATHASNARLLHKEQMSIRPRKHWWRHWWCHVPELAKDRETDIFTVFELPGGARIALHIENKRDVSRFTDGQAQAYAPRARHMLGKADYLNYGDFETMLIAAVAFRNRFPSDCSLFDVFISYEEIAGFVPLFKAA